MRTNGSRETNVDLTPLESDIMLVDRYPGEYVYRALVGCTSYGGTIMTPASSYATSHFTATAGRVFSLNPKNSDIPENMRRVEFSDKLRQQEVCNWIGIDCRGMILLIIA